jgi:hypothetical protein
LQIPPTPSKVIIATTLPKLEKGKPPHPVRLSDLEEMKLLWSEEWGAQDEVGKLRVALVKVET